MWILGITLTISGAKVPSAFAVPVVRTGEAGAVPWRLRQEEPKLEVFLE